MDYAGIIETAQRVKTYFAPFTAQLDEAKNPYGGDSVFKMKLIYQGYNPKLKGTTAKGKESDNYWEVKVRSDGSVMRKWGATGKPAQTKVEKKGDAAAGIAHAKSMAAKKKAKGYVEVKPGSKKAASKPLFPSAAKKVSGKGKPAKKKVGKPKGQKGFSHAQLKKAHAAMMGK